MGKQLEQPPLIVNTPSGEIPNPVVVTGVLTAAIKAQVEALTKKMPASLAEDERIKSEAEARRTQGSA